MIHAQFSSLFREDCRLFIYSRKPCPRAFLDQEVTTQRTNDAKFPDDKEQVNLKPNVEGVLECRGCIQGDYPVHLPDPALYTFRAVQPAHVVGGWRTYHG